MNRALKILGIGVVGLALVVAVGRFGIHKMAGDMATQIELQEVDVTSVPDGTWPGEYRIDESSARVEVDVAGGAITDIRILEHQHVRGYAGEGVTGRIVDEQTVAVDGMSGATLSSRVIQKAVEVALSDAKSS